MTISAIVPIYLNETNWEGIVTLTKQCLSSLKGYDELILIFDGCGDFSSKLEDVPNIAKKIHFSHQSGFASAVNMGINESSGDFIAIINNDTKMLQGSLKEMCHANSVVRPKLVGGELAKFAFVVIDRKVFEKVGTLDEDFKIGFFEDDDFLDRCQEAGVNLLSSPLQVWHYGGATMSQMNPDKQMEINKKIYENKRRLRHEQSGGSGHFER